ncbi:multidrug ABC transporter substrate-binding protein [Candidatus Poribacteria bacterium]|nr:MAG: multidrug ABC transporter substrate-binding protein [Candidatus Poribacteria bacterium]
MVLGGNPMSILESLTNALSALLANKLRSLLTMLGVIIGVGAIITTTSIGEGAKADITERIQTLGANILAVRPGQSRFRGRGSADARKSLTVADMEALEERGQTFGYVTPEVSSRAQVKYLNKNSNTTIVGTSPAYLVTANFTVEKGRFFTDSEIRYRQRVCVLGKTVVDNLFGETEPVGQTVKIKNVGFHVVGVMKEKGASGWRNPDDQVFIPYSTAMKRVFGEDYLSSISIQANDDKLIEAAETEVTELLRKQHKIPINKELDFHIRNQAEFMETLEESSQTFTNMILGIAVVSLVVGGIGIMNIMLVSVTERTKEIGLRKAVGAQRSDILVQFLVESTTLALVGGLVGIGVGIIGAEMVPSIWGWRTVISLMYAGAAFVVSALVGVFFGAYPAWKAAKLHPIDALRHE